MMPSNSHARWLSPNLANAIAAQIAACVYCPPFSLTPRDVPFDIAGIQIRFVERGIQELDQGIAVANEAAIDSRHCRARVPALPGAGQNRPTLRDRINLAFRITRRPKRRPVVKVS